MISQRNGRVVFWFTLLLDTFDAERLQILAEPRKRTLVEKAGQIIRTVGQELAAADADEEIEKLARDLFGARPARGLRQCGMRNTERRCIAAKLGDPPEQRGIRSARQQHGEQRVFLGARGVDFVELADMLAIKIRSQDRTRNPGRGFHRDHTPARDP
jgi:hypothetical protein